MKLCNAILILAFLLVSCSPAAGTPIPNQPINPVDVLPTPVIQTTHVPNPESAAIFFLDAWKSEDYPKMYSLLTQLSKDAITLDDFTKKYKETAINMTLQGIEYTILSSLTNPTRAQVAFRTTYKTVLLGEIQRDITMYLDQEKSYWMVEWEDGLILPELSGGNRLSMDVKIPARGNIYDRNESAIAAQADAVALGVVPSNILPDDEGNLLLWLSKMTNIPAPWIRSRYFGTENYYINVGETTNDRYLDYAGALANTSGVEVTPYNTRFYYDGGVAPQVTGYVQLVPAEELEAYQRKGYLGDEKVGVSGLERWGEDKLAGTHGGNLYVIDPQGQIVTRLASVEPVKSQSIYTTLDKNLQLGVQEALAGFAGSAVVIERDTGRVLAMASAPDYDPNLFDPNNVNFQFLGQSLSDTRQPLVNRATQGQYPLGSVFKIITMAAALESKLYTKESTYNCTSEFTEVQNLILYDWTVKKELPASGMLNLQEGLMRSCNPWFWHIGLDLFRKGVGTAIPDMARGFGLGSATGIEGVDEEVGNIPTVETEGDATNIAIGQGTLLVTPLQVANFVAAVGNGGTLYTPQIIEKIAPPDGDPTFLFEPKIKGKLPVSEENLISIQEAMRLVVAAPRGTAHRTFAGMQIPIYGKTGTAETSLGDQTHAWFAGYTDAKNPAKPDIAIAVMLEYQGEGSDWAAPIFRRIVELYYNGQISRTYPWETTYYVTATPTLPGGTATPEPSATPKKRK
jgi:penicillin-binding protein 2